MLQQRICATTMSPTRTCSPHTARDAGEHDGLDIECMNQRADRGRRRDLADARERRRTARRARCRRDNRAGRGSTVRTPDSRAHRLDQVAEFLRQGREHAERALRNVRNLCISCLRIVQRTASLRGALAARRRRSLNRLQFGNRQRQPFLAVALELDLRLRVGRRRLRAR